MNFQLKPESEFTQQGYLYLMEKSEFQVNTCGKLSDSDIVEDVVLIYIKSGS